MRGDCATARAGTARPGRRAQLLPYILMLLTLGPAGLAAQGPSLAATTRADTFTMTGVVVDASTGDPLPAAVVRVLGLDREDLTHDDGRFHLDRLPAGTHSLLAERFGYAARTMEVTLPRRNDGAVRIGLEPSAIALPGIMATATLGARSRAESHALGQVVGGRDLQRRMDLTLAETLDGEAGLAAASMGPAPARPVIRGLSGDRILVLEDGERPGDVSSTSADHAVAVETGSAERIEVVRGPSALFYGSNALGGVINVVREEIPSSLPDHPTGTLMVQGQSVSRGGLATATYRQAVGPAGLRLEASGRTAGEARTPVGVLPNTGMANAGGGAGLSWPGDFGHVGGAARIYRSEYGIPPDPVRGHAEGVTVEMERDALRGEVVAEDLAGFGHLTGEAGFTRYDHREIEPGGEIGTAFGQNTATGEAVLRHDELGPFVSGGLGLRGDWQAFSSDNGRSVVRATGLSGAIYGIEELELGDVLLQGGARYDVHRITPSDVGEVRGVPARERVFHNVSGSISSLWEFAAGWRLGTSVSRAFRAPSADELFTQGPHLAAYTYEVGNPELDPETGLGLDAFLRVERAGLSAEAGVFWNEIDDYSYPVNTGEQRGDLFVYRFINTEARFAGAEASASWAMTGSLVLEGDVSYVRATNLELDEPLPLIPPLNGQLDLRWDRESWFVEAGWRGAASQTRVPNRPEIPAGGADYCDRAPDDPDCRPVPGDFLATDGYGILNAGAGYRWFPGHQVHSITLRVENLTNELYRNHLSRIKELTPEPGIGVTLSYRASF